MPCDLQVVEQHAVALAHRVGVVEQAQVTEGVVVRNRRYDARAAPAARPGSRDRPRHVRALRCRRRCRRAAGRQTRRSAVRASRTGNCGQRCRARETATPLKSMPVYSIGGQLRRRGTAANWPGPQPRSRIRRLPQTRSRSAMTCQAGRVLARPRRAGRTWASRRTRRRSRPTMRRESRCASGAATPRGRWRVGPSSCSSSARGVGLRRLGDFVQVHESAREARATTEVAPGPARGRHGTARRLRHTASLWKSAVAEVAADTPQYRRAAPPRLRSSRPRGPNRRASGAGRPVAHAASRWRARVASARSSQSFGGRLVAEHAVGLVGIAGRRRQDERRVGEAADFGKRSRPSEHCAASSRMRVSSSLLSRAGAAAFITPLSTLARYPSRPAAGADTIRSLLPIAVGATCRRRAPTRNRT